MGDINIIYYNDFGIAFKWKKCAAKDLKKIQLVFRNTGLFLTPNELIQFSKNIKSALKQSLKCKGCNHQNSCKSILLETPIAQTSFAMNYYELKEINDLVKGTRFQLELNKLIENLIVF